MIRLLRQPNGSSKITSSESTASKITRNKTTLFVAGLAALLCAACLSGCGGGELNTEYGVRRAPRGEGSVAGVGVLADMFEERGHEVATWKRLSPKIRENDVIVWAPDSYEPPSDEAREFLEHWLYERSGRTLIYIGRDYYPAVDYWESVLAGAPAEQAETIQRRLARAKADRASQRAGLPNEEYGRWYTLDSTKPERKVRRLSGPWIDELKRAGTPIEDDKLGIELAARLRPPTEKETPRQQRGQLVFEELLTSRGDPLVTRVTFADDFVPPIPSDEEDEATAGPSEAILGDPFEEDDYEAYYDQHDEPYEDGNESQILVVANGSFLLNLSLVNKQHRLLAGKLIDDCRYQDQLQVAVLETGPYGVEVYYQEPDLPSYLDLLKVWPLNVILLHILGLGILVCFFFAPIFGRPVDRKVLTVVEGRPIYVSIASETTGPSDFGKHIEALGELMRRTAETDYARSRLDHYERHVRRDSGVSHKNAPPTSSAAQVGGVGSKPRH